MGLTEGLTRLSLRCQPRPQPSKCLLGLEDLLPRGLAHMPRKLVLLLATGLSSWTFSSASRVSF